MTYTEPPRVPNHRLKAELIPSPDASWDQIGRFALTFNGYDHWGSYERCAEIAHTRRNQTLTDLRTCLFYQQRSWRDQGNPDAAGMEYIRSLVEQIRFRVRVANELLA